RGAAPRGRCRDVPVVRRSVREPGGEAGVPRQHPRAPRARARGSHVPRLVVSPNDRKPSITARVRMRVSTFWGSTFDSRNRWIVLAGLALLGFVLGFVGLRRMAIDGHGDSSVLTLLYRDLATLSFSTGNAGTGGSIP